MTIIVNHMINNRPKISIVVPVYNVRTYLDKCVNSIINQTYDDIEVILVDDGSTDGSSDICDHFSNLPNVQVFHKQNGGLSSARNFGFEKVTGDYVCFIDSDDYLGESYISQYLAGVNENADIIIGDYTITIGNSSKEYEYTSDVVKGLYECEKDNIFLQRLITRGEFMSVWRNMYSIRFLHSINLTFTSEREVFAEDDLYNTIAYYYSKRIFKVDSVDYFHMINKGSLSQSYRPGLFHMDMRRFWMKMDFLKEKSSSYIPALEASLPNIIANALYKESLCPYKQAVKNIREIASSSSETFAKYAKVKNKYCLQYFFARKRLYFLVVLLSKLFAFCEPVYRFITLNLRK